MVNLCSSDDQNEQQRERNIVSVFDVKISKKLKFKPIQQLCEVFTQYREVSTYKEIQQVIFNDITNVKINLQQLLPLISKQFRIFKKECKGIILKEDVKYFDIVHYYTPQSQIFKTQEHVIEEKVADYFNKQRMNIDMMFGIQQNMMRYIYLLKWQKNIHAKAIIYVNEPFPVKEIMKMADAAFTKSK
eukprot:EST43463.1 Hypothetical protein SS50377_16827 [Spironucleus salmonicida]